MPFMQSFMDVGYELSAKSFFSPRVQKSFSSEHFENLLWLGPIWYKDERGTTDCWVSPTGPCDPQKIWAMRPYFALLRGQSDLGSGKQVRNGNFLSVQVFFYGPGLNFDSSKMIYISIHQRAKEIWQINKKRRHKTVLTSVQSSQCWVYRGFKWIPLSQGKFYQNLVGWSGIGVLVVGLRFLSGQI